jgi:hypothetical protein
MSTLHDGYRSTLRASTSDSEKGSSRKIGELLARMGQPNEINVCTKATATLGKQWTRLAQTAGFRIKSDNGTGTGLTFRRYAANQDTPATLTTALAGANNDLVFTSVPRGVVGNDTTITYAVAGNNTVLSVAVVGQAITVTVGTGAGGAATSTAAQVKAAIDALPAAAALVTVALAAANDGTGIVAALGATNLANGADAPVASVAVASGASIDLPCVADAQEWEVKRTDNGAAVTLRALVYNMA